MRLGKKIKGDISVVLQGGRPTAGLNRYKAGAHLAGMVRVTPDANLLCEHLYVEIGWRTEGDGNAERQKVREVDVYQGLLKGGVTSSHSFSIDLPNAPWSYSGRHIRIIWEAKVYLHERGARRPRSPRPLCTQPFELSSSVDFCVSPPSVANR